MPPLPERAFEGTGPRHSAPGLLTAKISIVLYGRPFERKQTQNRVSLLLIARALFVFAGEAAGALDASLRRCFRRGQIYLKCLGRTVPRDGDGMAKKATVVPATRLHQRMGRRSFSEAASRAPITTDVNCVKGIRLRNTRGRGL
jgi:hypothetical protein